MSGLIKCIPDNQCANLCISKLRTHLWSHAKVDEWTQGNNIEACVVEPLWHRCTRSHLIKARTKALCSKWSKVGLQLNLSPFFDLKGVAERYFLIISPSGISFFGDRAASDESGLVLILGLLAWSSVLLGMDLEESCSEGFSASISIFSRCCLLPS